MRTAFLIYLFLCWSVLTAVSQNYEYSLRNYSAVDGLPQSQVAALLEDKNGYLWVGTQGGGLARFDGREFKTYSTVDGLMSTEVGGLYQDIHKNIWILSSRGATKYDGLNFKNFDAPASISPSKLVRYIYELQDTLFLITQSGMRSKIYNDSVYYWARPLVKNKKIWRAHKATDGGMFFLMDDGSCVIQSGKTSFSIRADIETGTIINIFNWRRKVLIRTKKGLYALNSNHKKLDKLRWNTKGFVLWHDEKRDIFWTQSDRTLLMESISGETTKCDTVLRNVRINRILIDSENNTWFGSDGKGLYKYFIQDFNRYEIEGLSGVMAIEKDNEGTLWAGTMTNGLWKINDGKTKLYEDRNEPHRNVIHTIKVAPDGNLWVGTGYGLGKYTKRNDSFTWYLKEDGLPGYSIQSISFDDLGGMFIATNNGLGYYDGKLFKKIGAGDGKCWSMHYSKDDHQLFFSTVNSLYAIKDGKLETISIPNLNSTIMSIHAYGKSSLLLGTGGSGVVIMNIHTRKSKFITSHQGLASDYIYFAAEDEKHHIWIGTEKGINNVKLNDHLDIVENLHYGYDNGLTGVETNHNAFYLSPEKKYFGLVDGVYQFNDRDMPGKMLFNLHLTDVQILYGEHSIREYADSVYSFFKIPYNPILPPDRNHLTFHFNQIDKDHPKSVQFKYFLENYDKTWSPLSSSNQVTYGNLPPGDYIFRIMATNNRGAWANNRIAYAFTIRAPFYMQATFIIGMVLLTIGLITIVLYLRVKSRIRKVVQKERIRTREQEMLRKEIARDFHDEMGNQLTRIINYVSLLKLKGAHENGQGELYSKVESSAKYLYTGTRDFIWAIDPVNDELSQLFIHIRDFGEKLFEEKNINFRAFNDIKEKVKLPYGFSREANLIFKEAMTNAFKYSKAKNVGLALHRKDDGFQMILEDDGIGFCPDDVEKSNGLINIHERAKRIHGILQVSSTLEKGTKITLDFKLNKKLKYGITF